MVVDPCDETCHCGHYDGHLDLWDVPRSHRGPDPCDYCVNHVSTEAAQDRDTQELQEDKLGMEQYMPMWHGGAADTGGRSHCSLEKNEQRPGHNSYEVQMSQTRLCDHLGHLRYNRRGRLCWCMAHTASWNHSTAEQNSLASTECSLLGKMDVVRQHDKLRAGRLLLAVVDNYSEERSWGGNYSEAMVCCRAEQDLHSNRFQSAAGRKKLHCVRHSPAGDNRRTATRNLFY